MTDSDSPPSSHPLEFPTSIWIGLAVVLLLGASQHFRDWADAALRRRPAFTIVRQASSTHEFRRMGAKISLPAGWVYLSTAKDEVAVRATFVHSRSQSIVSLRQVRFNEWPPDGHPVQKFEFSNFAVDWVRPKDPRTFSLDDDLAQSAGSGQLRWTDFDPRTVGRIHSEPAADRAEDQGLIMLVVTHGTGGNLTDSVRELIESITIL